MSAKTAYCNDIEDDPLKKAFLHSRGAIEEYFPAMGSAHIMPYSQDNIVIRNRLEQNQWAPLIEEGSVAWISHYTIKGPIGEVIKAYKDYSPESIILSDKIYNLKFPLRCLFEREEDYFVIKNEMLDLIGTGRTEEEVKKDFNEEFDYLYKRLNSLGDEQLSDKMKNIKFVLNHIVHRIIIWQL